MKNKKLPPMFSAVISKVNIPTTQNPMTTELPPQSGSAKNLNIPFTEFLTVKFLQPISP